MENTTKKVPFDNSKKNKVNKNSDTNYIKTENKEKKSGSKRMNSLTDAEYREFEKKNAIEIRDAIERVRMNQNRENNLGFNNSASSNNSFLESYYEDDDEDDYFPQTDSRALVGTNKDIKPLDTTDTFTKTTYDTNTSTKHETAANLEIPSQKKPLNLNLLSSNSPFFNKIAIFLYNKDYDKYVRLHELNIDFETARDLYNNDDSINLSNVT
jgi:hypothetical protein